jgi:hypothetical protein
MLKGLLAVAATAEAVKKGDVGRKVASTFSCLS